MKLEVELKNWVEFKWTRLNLGRICYFKIKWNVEILEEINFVEYGRYLVDEMVWFDNKWLRVIELFLL